MPKSSFGKRFSYFVRELKACIYLLCAGFYLFGMCRCFCLFRVIFAVFFNKKPHRKGGV
jgi:hypothetical protein